MPKSERNTYEGDSEKQPYFQSLKRDFYRRLSKASFVLEIVGVFVVAAYTTIAALQWCDMRTAALAAKESADAAVASVRAWIVVTKYDPPRVQAMKLFNMPFAVEFENAGKTPATDISDGIEFVFVPKDRPAPKFKGCPKNEDTPEMLIRAGQPFSINPEIKPHLSADQKESLTNGNAGGSLFIHGCLHYHDVLTRKQRVTEFCGFYFIEMMFDCSGNNELK